MENVSVPFLNQPRASRKATQSDNRTLSFFSNLGVRLPFGGHLEPTLHVFALMTYVALKPHFQFPVHLGGFGFHRRAARECRLRCVQGYSPRHPTHFRIPTFSTLTFFGSAISPVRANSLSAMQREWLSRETGVSA